MVRSWLLRVAFLAIAFNGFFFLPGNRGQGDHYAAVPGKISADGILDRIALQPNPVLAGGMAGIGKSLSPSSGNLGEDPTWRVLIPLLFKNWSPEMEQPNPIPEITALNPEGASRGDSGSLLTITGTGFIHSSAVYFNTHLLMTDFIDENQLQTVIPPEMLNAAGVFPVNVGNPAPQGGLSNTRFFTVLNPVPVLSAFSPESIRAGSPGFTLTLAGSNFESGATVQFNDVNVLATRVSDSRIDAAIPAEAIGVEGNVPVAVINPAPGGGPSEPLTFPVTRASNVAPLPQGSFGKPYEDLFPRDAFLPAYDPKRFSLITGRVKGVNGDPLPEVTVSIHGRPEYGTVASDAGGKYSLPVDGGGTVTIVFHKPGLLPAHRTIEAGWNTIAPVEDLVLIVEDSAATAVAFDGRPDTILRHTSSPTSDAFGPRALTMVFSGDNRAWVKDTQGNEQPLTNITVRATEFTTPESMPAKLPPASAFTYCAELSVDGAEAVRFEKPVSVYVDNFLGFAVGAVVPVGFYDRERAVWVPADNGVVVRLLDTDQDGLVDACTDGRNQYPAPGLTDPVRFVPDSTFWRVEVSHFTPWDCNWPFGPPADAIPPNPPSPPVRAIQGKPCELTRTGSYVENQECTFHEELPIPGTELFLHYASNRTPGFNPRVTIPASGSSVPASLLGIVVRMEVAGRVYEVTLPPLPDQQAEFIWDGRDHLGREVVGASPARVRIGFEYPMVYYSGSSIFAQAFAQPGTEATWVRARENVIAWKESALTLHRGKGDLAAGWTLSAQHLLIPSDPDTLQKGDGASLRNQTRILATVAAATPVGDGTSLLKGVAVDGAGNIYFSDGYNYRYMKVEPGGAITYYSTLDIPAGGYQGMVRPSGLALDGAGNLYFTSPNAYHGGFVGKMDPAGQFSIIAGNLQQGFSGDGGPATAARLNYPEEVAVDAYGNIYITDTWNNRIRKVDPNGIITTVAGNGQYGYGGDGGPATQARLANPSGLALDSQGNLYFTDTQNNRVRKVDPSGIITTVAGNGQAGFSGDGGPAPQAGLAYPEGLAIDRSGNLYVADAFNYRIRKVTPAGIISTLAGNGQRSNNNGEGGPAAQATVHDPTGVAVDSKGNVYVAITGYGRIKKVSLPGALKNQTFSEDTVFTDGNGQGYVLGSNGIHKSTYDLATGKTLLTFGYDQAGNLVSLTDRFGNQTTLQRAGSGAPLSITSPDGIVTRLTVDGNNQLTAVTYPDHGVYAFTYTSDGLLTGKTDPRGGRFGNQYDAGGLVTGAFDPEGGTWDFSRVAAGAGNTRTTLQTAEGNATSYQERTDFTGTYTSVKTDPWGSSSTFSRSADGLTETDQPSCGPNLTRQYDLDPAYRYQYLKEFTRRSPAGRTRTVTETRTYQDTNADTIPDRITSMLKLNGRDWTSSIDTLAGTIQDTSPLGRAATITYSPLTLLPQQVAVSDLFPLTYAYDTRGRRTSAAIGNRTTAISYDAEGRVSSILTPDQKTLGYTYDPLGRLKTQVLPDNTVIAYEYDLNGNPTALTNPRGISHSFEYTGVNQRRSLENPLSGSYQYTYDKERQLKTIAFPSGRAITHTYTSGLLTSRTAPEGATTFSYFCGSLPGEATRGSEKVSYGYDGSLLTSDTRSGLLNQTIVYTYNDDFKLAALSYGGDTQSLTYDHDGLLIGAGAFSISRNARNGLPVGITDGIYAAARTFNGYGELEAITYTLGGASPYGYSLTRDTAGRITRKIETVAGVPGTYDYSYDPNGRLSEVRKEGSVVESYSYDPNGNRTRETNTFKGFANRVYSYSAEDQLLTAESDSYQFDADGFLTGRILSNGASSFQYSSRGELLEAKLPGATAIAYDHDPLGRRIAKRIGGTITEKYLWADATTLLAVYDENDNPVMRFSYGDERMPLSMTANGNSYYLLYDPIGSLRAVIDSSGNIVKRIDYDSFGNIIVDTNAALSIPFGFAGGLHDRTTGLVRFGARDYDPAIGRWTAKDPIDFAGGDTNLFGYVGGDPVNWVDPSGLWEDNIHYSGTYTWALQLGISDQQAKKIALGSSGADGGFASWMPIFGDQSRHFNIAKSGMKGYADSRDFWADAELKRAVNYFKTGNCEAAFGHLGKGLHSLQDKFAHRDWNTGPFGWDPHPIWYDKWDDPKNMVASQYTENVTKEYLSRFLKLIGQTR